jgi:proteasome activator subunit 4
MDENLGPGRGAPASALAATTALKQLSSLAPFETISRATSPGVPYAKYVDDDKKRYRPRTFAYFRQLPFAVEDEREREAALRNILKNLYIAVKAEDFNQGATHWTRELTSWINLKFEMTRLQRAKLVKLFYSLALTPGLESSSADRFLRMVVSLTRYVGCVLALWDCSES